MNDTSTHSSVPESLKKNKNKWLLFGSFTYLSSANSNDVSFEDELTHHLPKRTDSKNRLIHEGHITTVWRITFPLSPNNSDVSFENKSALNTHIKELIQRVDSFENDT